MRLDDRALPAARHLAGDHAIDVLRIPVEAAGGVIESLRTAHVQYRPGSDAIVRYTAQVSWNGAPPVRETFAAATTLWGPLPGTAVVAAETADGPLEIGVWRWPFDPVLTGLADVVDRRRMAAMVNRDPADVTVEVVAYRPTERVVVAVRDPHHGDLFVKVVPPSCTDAIGRRHLALREAGVPAPALVDLDRDRGIVVTEAIVGPTLRDLVKSDAPGWPETSEFDQLADRLSAVDLDLAGPASRVTDGVLHARMLAAVLPRLRDRFHTLADRFESAGAAPADGVVHGDLHEGQMVVHDGRVVGLFDLDDVGTGASIDDRANLVARLEYRAVVDAAGDRRRRTRLLDYGAGLRTSAVERHGAATFDLHVAACLVGLATGPFRLQGDGWRESVADLLDRAERLAEGPAVVVRPRRARRSATNR